MIDAQALIIVANSTGVVVRGLSLPDVDDTSTWMFTPSLSDDDRAVVVSALQAALAPPPPPPPPKITVGVVDFLKAVTDAEWAAFSVAATQNVLFARAKAILDHSLTITPTDGYFVVMMNAAVDAGVLTPARRDALLAQLTS